MSVYTAIRWYDDGGEPEVRLFEDISFAADWLTYPWLGDFTDSEMQGFSERLRSFRAVKPDRFGSHECWQILNLEVTR